MSLLRSTSLYTIGNGVIALVGLMLTIALGRLLGPDGFGVWASFFAVQNIWASMGFMRLETRLASAVSVYQANRIIYAGFLCGFLVTVIFCTLLIFVMKSELSAWMAIMSGFGLAVFDVLSQRMAYEGRQLVVLSIRTVRTLLPLLVAVIAVLAGLSVSQVIAWQAIICIVFALLVWGRWIQLQFWRLLCVNVICQYKHGLTPSIIMSLLNGLWINGMTPMLNQFATSAIAGQFAMIQRLVGGALGLMSTSIGFSMLERDYIKVHWPSIRNVFITNIAISISLCVLLALPIMNEAGRLLGLQWSVDLYFYLATCAFLVSSFSIGSISVLSMRLNDEWFLVVWQLGALISWIILYALMPIGQFFVIALWMGSGMYFLLAMRWRHLAIKREV